MKATHPKPLAKESIYTYFTRVLGTKPDDTSLKELPCDSGCGDDCVAAIDAAKEFLLHSEAAVGKSPLTTNEIVAICDRTVTVYWRG